jgi:hypothetical protein
VVARVSPVKMPADFVIDHRGRIALAHCEVE